MTSNTQQLVAIAIDSFTNSISLVCIWLNIQNLPSADHPYLQFITMPIWSLATSKSSQIPGYKYDFADVANGSKESVGKVLVLPLSSFLCFTPAAVRL